MIDFDGSVFVSRAPHGSDDIRESKYGKFFVASYEFLKISQADASLSFLSPTTASLTVYSISGF